MTEGFVGRDKELGALANLLTGDDRVPPVAEVAGEPGIGKSRLLREFAGIAAERGYQVWYGRATQYERTTPFDLLLHALGNSGARLAAFQQDCPEQAAVLASIIPDFATGTFAYLPLAEVRHHLYGAIGSLLGWAAKERGLVVLFDDIHWADAETLQWLRYLLRRPLPEGMSMVLAHRHQPLPTELAMTLTEARADGVVSLVTLGPLALADAAFLVTGSPGPRDAEELYRASGGSPLYLLTLRDKLQTAAMPPSHTPDPAGRLRPAVLAEIESLPAHARLLARAAAVAGDPFDPALAVAIASMDESSAREALDSLAACGLIHRDHEVGGFAFRHPLVREIIYSDAGEGWVIHAHSRAVEFLGSLNLPATRLAEHAERCARPGDWRLAGILTEAGRAVMPHAPHTAAHWLGAALRLTSAGADPAGELDLRLDLAYALSVSGRFDRGWQVLAGLVNPPGRASQHKALMLASLLERHLGRTDSARQALQHAVNRSTDARMRTMLVIELCYHHLMRGDIVSHAKYAQEALVLARQCGDPLREAVALAQLTLADLAHGNVAAAARHRNRAAEIIDVVPDRELRDDLDACCHLASGELQLEMFSQARAHADRVAELAHASRCGIVLIQATTLRALTSRQIGDITLAWRYADEALEMARSTGSDRWRMTILALRSELAVVRGEPAEAITSGTAALQLATAPADMWLTRHVPTVLAVAKFFTGQRDGCVEQVLSTYGGADLPALEVGSRVRVYETLAWMDALHARPEAARKWAERASLASAVVDLPSAEGFAHLARAEAALSADPRLARQHARAAMAAFRGAGSRYEASRAQLADALATLAAEGPEAGVRLLAEAETALTSCGARLPADFASSLPVTTDPLATLSPREREVADLVAHGYTNRRIARELGMSEKTVETHMSRIFSKLGAGNRAMVASMIGRRALYQGFS